MLSLLLHLLILWLFVKKWENLKLIPPPAQDKKISLDLQQITPPPAPKPKAQPVTVPPVPKPVVTPPVTQPVAEKQERPEPKREVLKQKHVDERAKVFAEKSSEEHNLTEPVPKPEKKIAKKEVVKKEAVKKEVEKKPLKKVAERPVAKKVVAKKPVLQKRATPRRPKRSGDPLANALMGSGTSMYPAKNTRRPSSSGSYGERMIHTLYGEEFNSFTETQKKYIKNNLGTIHRITQNTLTRNGYPEIAVRTRQQGVNVVSFYLHPNGDISDLKLKKHIGYAALDENTLEVIRIAYKDYPLPNKKTKIIFNVNYSLY